MKSNPGTREKESNASNWYQFRVIVDARRTLQPVEIMLLVKLYRKRSMGSLISLDEPVNTSLPYKKGVL